VPTYQYACTACGERLEAVQAFTDPALTDCPACHGRLRKVFSPVGVVFKGSGFYKTDSRAPVTSGSKTGATGSESGDARGSARNGEATAGEPPAGKPAGGSPAPAAKDAGTNSSDRPATSSPGGSAVRQRAGERPASAPAG
jgi:putative FmdB family regulatory protein